MARPGSVSASRRNLAVVGGGWAGCSAAVELARAGHRITLFEAARTLGGRARSVEIEGMPLDNGQHILLGAYRETLRILHAVGVDENAAMLRLPLQMRYPARSSGMDFAAPRLPAPLHLLAALLRAKGLSRDDKLALVRFWSAARWMEWQLDNDCTVSELLARFNQTARLIQLMWRPLCIAALNTPPERASAQVFLNVLRDSLGANRAASDMMIPRTDLSLLFPQHAARFIVDCGGKVETGCAVAAVKRDGEHWEVATADGRHRFDAMVIATPPLSAAMLLAGLIDTAPLSAFTYEPITTCYLQYEPGTRLSQPFLALIDNPAQQEWGQFVFDRGAADPKQAGLLAVVVSASTDAIADGHGSLTAALARQLAAAFGMDHLRHPRWSKIITEKRATFSCSPGLSRPANDTGLPGLVLAGDYCASDYPATLETAVRSGTRAARQIIDAFA